MTEIYRSISEYDCFSKQYCLGYSIIVIMSIFISVVDKKMSLNIMNGIVDIDSIFNFIKVNILDMNNIFKKLIDMIRLGDDFCIDRNDFNYDEKIQQYYALWGNAYYGYRGEIDAEKKLIDTVSLLNLYG